MIVVQHYNPVKWEKTFTFHREDASYPADATVVITDRALMGDDVIWAIRDWAEEVGRVARG